MIPLGVLAAQWRPASGGSPTLIKTATGATTTSTATSVTATIGSTAGGLLVAFLGFRFQISTAPTIDGLTLMDWVDGTARDGASIPGLAIYAGPAGAQSVTATWSLGSNAALIVAEYANATPGESVVTQEAASVDSTTAIGSGALAAAFTGVDGALPDDVSVASSGSINVRATTVMQDATGGVANWSHPSVAHSHGGLELI